MDIVVRPGAAEDPEAAAGTDAPGEARHGMACMIVISAMAVGKAWSGVASYGAARAGYGGRI